MEAPQSWTTPARARIVLNLWLARVVFVHPWGWSREEKSAPFFLPTRPGRGALGHLSRSGRSWFPNLPSRSHGNFIYLYICMYVYIKCRFLNHWAEEPSPSPPLPTILTAALLWARAERGKIYCQTKRPHLAHRGCWAASLGPRPSPITLTVSPTVN